MKRVYLLKVYGEYSRAFLSMESLFRYCEKYEITKCSFEIVELIGDDKDF